MSSGGAGTGPRYRQGARFNGGRPVRSIPPPTPLRHTAAPVADLTECPVPDIVVVMGVSGSGKTTVATGIATAMEWEFAEGDDFHPGQRGEDAQRPAADRRRPLALAGGDRRVDQSQGARR